MNYLTLYRQWRPQTFSEVVGQKNTVTGLRNAVREGKLAHAYLFFGPRGSGKTSVAKIMAKAVNCSQPGSGEPCNTCPACCDTITARLWMLEIDAASTVELMRLETCGKRLGIACWGKKSVHYR